MRPYSTPYRHWNSRAFIEAVSASRALVLHEELLEHVHLQLVARFTDAEAEDIGAVDLVQYGNLGMKVLARRPDR